jgi:hypothetical protein
LYTPSALFNEFLLIKKKNFCLHELGWYIVAMLCSCIPLDLILHL